jgi:predicted Zn-dependent peptidase
VDLERLERAFEEELERLGHEPVTDDELARARALVESDELGALQRVEERADRLSMFATLFDDPDMVNRMLDRYLSVEADAVRAVAADVFAADNRAVLTYLPLAPTADEQAGPTVRPVEDADDEEEEAA